MKSADDVSDIFDNQLIFRDSLLALKVMCVFINTPYNTGTAFIPYNDGVEHSIRLSRMRGI